ncbi:nitrous oxide reductase family maturation protein NosD [Thermoproteota archaeon]
MRKISPFILILLFCMVWVTIPNIGIVKAQGTIYIKADGSVEGTDKIQCNGNVYTFLGNISIEGSGADGIIVERDNILIDGIDFALQLTGEMGISRGIKLTDRTNVTIKNLRILDFNYGIQLHRSTNNTILRNYIFPIGIILEGAHNNSIISNYLSTIEMHNWYQDGCSSGNLFLGNNITNGGVGINSVCGYANIISGNNITNCIGSYGGIFLQSSANIIVGNNFENNTVGIFFSHGASNNTLYQNNFINNQKDMDDAHSVLPIYEISINDWDNGSRGNYWSDYNGTDNDGDGIGDTPHFVYENNQDNYPLKNQVDISEIPEFPSWIILPILIVSTLTVIVIRNRIRKKGLE